MSNSKTATFRTDASHNIGSGHLMRCIALADRLKSKGWETHFICRNLDGNLFEVIEARGHRLFKLPQPEKRDSQKIDPNDHEANLEVTWERDAEETVRGLKSLGGKPDWLIVDHYSLDSRWEGRLACAVERILVVDDNGERPHECDMILNQNPLPHIQEKYKKTVPERIKLLLGLPYVLLGPDYEEAGKGTRSGGKTINRILVFYGSADATNETGKALTALLELNRKDISIDVVLGSANPHRKTIETQVKSMGNVALHIQLASLASLIKQADLALSAGGGTIYELLTFGVPILVTTTAKNQVPSIRHLSQLEVLTWLGNAPEVPTERIKSELAKTLNDQQILLEKSRRGAKMIDGQGTQRVATIMESFSRSSGSDNGA